MRNEKTGLNPKRETNERKYVRICQNLVGIPRNISNNTKIISIIGNKDITSLQHNTFKEVLSCEMLNLKWNRIENVSVSTFIGLIKLKRLFLEHNKIRSIKNGTFSGLIALERIYLEFNEIHSIGPGTFVELTSGRNFRIHLNSNNLTTLSKDIVTSSLNPKTLELALVGNKLECDWNLCWLKRAESDGWLTWLPEPYSKPDCLNKETFFDDTCGSK